MAVLDPEGKPAFFFRSAARMIPFCRHSCGANIEETLNEKKKSVYKNGPTEGPGKIRGKGYKPDKWVNGFASHRGNKPFRMLEQYSFQQSQVTIDGDQFNNISKFVHVKRNVFEAIIRKMYNEKNLPVPDDLWTKEEDLRIYVQSNDLVDDPDWSWEDYTEDEKPAKISALAARAGVRSDKSQQDHVEAFLIEALSAAMINHEDESNPLSMSNGTIPEATVFQPFLSNNFCEKLFDQNPTKTQQRVTKVYLVCHQQYFSLPNMCWGLEQCQEYSWVSSVTCPFFADTGHFHWADYIACLVRNVILRNKPQNCPARNISAFLALEIKIKTYG